MDTVHRNIYVPETSREVNPIIRLHPVLYPLASVVLYII